MKSSLGKMFLLGTCLFLGSHAFGQGIEVRKKIIEAFGDGGEAGWYPNLQKVVTCGTDTVALHLNGADCNPKLSLSESDVGASQRLGLGNSVHEAIERLLAIFAEEKNPNIRIKIICPN